MKDSFVMRTENKISIDRMSDEDAGRLLKAILAHVAGEDVDDAEEPLAVQLMLPLITAQIDRADEKYQQIAEKRREAGSLGGKAKQSQANDSKAKQTEAELSDAKPIEEERKERSKEKREELPEPEPVPEPVPDIQKESPSVMRKSAPRFVPPTADIVRSYVDEQGLHVDPQRFVDFYASKDWMVGKNKMKDWKAACRNWASRDKPPAPEKSFGRERIDYDALTRQLAYGGMT